MTQPRRGPESRIPRTDGKPTFEAAPDLDLTVKLPGGGTLTLLSPDEVTLWNETAKRYIRDYKIEKQNDLVQLGAILSQALALYRAQKDMADEKKAGAAQAMITSAADQIRKGEKTLGIDKATREKGGAHDTADYLARLKKAAYEKGIHISNRVLEYERVCNEARWKIRILRNGDVEDRQYHKLTEVSIVKWLEVELGKLEEADREWAREKGALWVGTL